MEKIHLPPIDTTCQPVKKKKKKSNHIFLQHSRVRRVPHPLTHHPPHTIHTYTHPVTPSASQSPTMSNRARDAEGEAGGPQWAA